MHKFSPRDNKHVFIGYSPHQKGYKVYNLDTKTISVSRDVIFFEKRFPYHYQTHTDTSKTLPQFFLPTSTNEPCIYDYSEPFLPFSNFLHPISHIPDLPTSSSQATIPVPQSPTQPDHIAPTHSPEPVTLRRSQRQSKPHAYLTDYYYHNVVSNHWCNLVSFKALSSSHQQISQQL